MAPALPDDILRRIAALSGDPATALLCKSACIPTWQPADRAAYMLALHKRDALKVAAAHGMLDVIDAMIATACKGVKRATCEAARSGHLPIMRRLLALHETRTTVGRAFEAAASAGQLAVVRELAGRVQPSQVLQALRTAARDGHLDTVLYLADHVDPEHVQHALFEAAERGHTDIVRKLRHALDPEWHAWALTLAADSGHLDIVHDLRQGLAGPLKHAALCCAAQNGHLDVVRELRRGPDAAHANADASRALLHALGYYRTVLCQQTMSMYCIHSKLHEQVALELLRGANAACRDDVRGLGDPRVSEFIVRSYSRHRARAQSRRQR